MEIRVLDFFLGVAAGFVLGLGLFWLAGRVRAWLGRSEVGRLTRENRELKSALHNMIISFINALTEIVKKGQEEGQIRTDMEPQRIAIMFLGLFQPSAFLYHLSDGRFDIVKQVDMTWKMFCKAIKSSKS